MSPHVVFTAATVLLAGTAWMAGLRRKVAARARRYQDPGLHAAPDGRSSWYAEMTWFDHSGVMRWHLNGTPWDRARLPRLVHRCWPQTCEITRTLAHMDRCACGARRYGLWGKWYERSSR